MQKSMVSMNLEHLSTELNHLAQLSVDTSRLEVAHQW
jgi:hypothetical protein